MNTFQLKIDSDRCQGLKYQIYTKDLIQDPELKQLKRFRKVRKKKWEKKRGQFRKLVVRIFDIYKFLTIFKNIKNKRVFV